ncbi:MAG: thymidylate synthase [Candidatus Aenigmatarchaeota archaeon]
MIKDIVIINEKSNIAISTLWLKKEVLLSKIPDEFKNKICIIGTTYTNYGVNFILQTLGEFNNIDTLILYGPDLSSSGSAIENVFGKKILDSAVLFNKKSIEGIIKSVKLIDLRKEFENNNIKALLNAIEKNFNIRKNHRKKFKLIINEKIELDSWPIPLSGHFIYDNKSIFRAWVKILDLILKYGSLKLTEYEEPQKEYLNVVVTLGLYGNNYELESEFFEFINKKEFENHVNEVINPKKPFGVEYTYGERIFKHRFGKNQLKYLINKLSKHPYSRRALIISWDHEIDKSSKNPPCIIGIQGTITDNFYNHTVFIRSNDMFRGWPVNFLAQIELAKKIVNEINKKAKTDLSIGCVTSISTSAHIYKHDWLNAYKVLEKYSYKTKEFIEDPKGNFLIYYSNNKIVVEQREPKSMRLVSKVKSNEFSDIYNHFKNGNMFTLASHAFYLGKEIKTAFEKLSKKERYIQDYS